VYLLAVAVICGCSLLSFVVADDKELVAFVATTLGIHGKRVSVSRFPAITVDY
jgi:hypothetical protein